MTIEYLELICNCIVYIWLVYVDTSNESDVHKNIRNIVKNKTNPPNKHHHFLIQDTRKKSIISHHKSFPHIIS